MSAEGVKLGLASRRGSDLGLPDALGLTCDVRDIEQVDAAVAATVDRFGGLDIVVANAGVGSYHPFGEEPLEHVEEMIDVNLKGTIYTIRAALPHLKRSDARRRDHARVRGGRRGFPGEAVYCASKFGQVGLDPRARRELRPLGIRATNVCPGGVATEFALARLRPAAGRPRGMMTGEDVAEVVLFVLTRPRGMRIWRQRSGR